MIVLQAISATLLVCALILILYWFGQKLNLSFLPKRDSQLLSVLETTPLGDKRSLVLVRIEDKDLLLGVTHQQITRLAQFPSFDSALTVKREESEKTASESRFALLFRKARQQ